MLLLSLRWSCWRSCDQMQMGKAVLGSAYLHMGLDSVTPARLHAAYDQQGMGSWQACPLRT